YRLPQHAQVGVFLGQSRAQALPARAGVAAAPDRRLALGHVATGDVRVQRDDVHRLGLARVDRRREAELGRQPRGDLLPARAAVVAAVDAAVVLLVQPLRPAGRHLQVVDALAGLGILLGRGVGPHAAVLRRP